MYKTRSWRYVVLPLVCTYFVSACTSGVIAPTQTLVPTNTPTATATATLTATSTPTPTSTPLPTATEVPPTSTAAPMGEPVSTNDYEVNVITMRTIPSVYDNTFSKWVPKDGFMFVEVGIKVANLNPSTTISVPIGKINIIEEDGRTWYPSWGFAKPVVSGIEVIPKSLTLASWKDFPLEPVTFDDVVFIRTVYVVKKHNPTTLLFRFGDSPLIEIIVPK